MIISLHTVQDICLCGDVRCSTSVNMYRYSMLFLTGRSFCQQDAYQSILHNLLRFLRSLQRCCCHPLRTHFPLWMVSCCRTNKSSTTITHFWGFKGLFPPPSLLSLLQWFQTAPTKTCPQCRKQVQYQTLLNSTKLLSPDRTNMPKKIDIVLCLQVTTRHIISKLYFDIGGEEEPSADPESLQVPNLEHLNEISVLLLTKKLYDKRWSLTLQKDVRDHLSLSLHHQDLTWIVIFIFWWCFSPLFRMTLIEWRRF